MKTRTIYEAFDGKIFDTHEACRVYEAERIETRLVGLTLDQVRAALSREDTEIADVIEELGARIAKARREAGDFRRRKGSSEPEAATKTAEQLVEEQARNAARTGAEREPPEQLTAEMREIWVLAYDYELLERAA